mgnify:FL=1
MKRFSFIIVAAGLGERMGGSPKQFRRLGGKPLWQWSFFTAWELFMKKAIHEIVIVVPPFAVEQIRKEVAVLSGSSQNCTVTAGGQSRTESVRNGLKGAGCEYVLVHDAARPFLSVNLCHRIIEAMDSECGVIPVLPITDALKKVETIQNQEAILSLSRENLYITQTPQAFPRCGLLTVLKGEDDSYRDEAEAWLKFKGSLKKVEGDSFNMKITYPQDFQMAEMLMRNKKEYRTGQGFDIHPLTPSRILVLGGVTIDSPLGLEGHSDGDVITHAVMDALLGAAGLPDIGILFPASEPSYKDAYSFDLLKEVASLLQRDRWNIEWVDVTLQAQVPPLASYIDVIVEKLKSGLCHCGDKKLIVHLKVKSGELIGPVGNAQCMICTATATLSRNGRFNE